jgi:cytochrome c551/c552
MRWEAPQSSARAGIIGVLATLLVVRALPAQAPPTPAQNISAGASVYGAKGCGGCHAINGIGAALGPDLATIAAPSLNALVSAIWGHLPQMAGRFAAAGTDPPHLDAWEAADLMAFLFWAASASPVGSPDTGRALFAEKGCVACHQVGNVGGVLGPRLDGSAARFSSIELAAALWNHAPAMGAEMVSRGVRRPTLSGSDLDHLVAYLRASGDATAPPAIHALAGRPDAGRALFRERGCIRCHRVGAEGGDVGPDLSRAAPRQPAAFAAAMWNKGPRMTAAMRSTNIRIPSLTGADMADLVAYLGTFQYLAGAGSAARGAAAARAGGCTACHSLNALTAMRGMTGRSAVIAALWNHVRLPADTLRRAWRPITPEQVADLMAYFERRGQTR